MSRLYLVRWFHDYYYLNSSLRGGAPMVLPVPRSVRAFLDPVAAQEFAFRLTQGAVPWPAVINPFRGLNERWMEDRTITTVADVTSMPEPIFCDWLREAGLEPPAEAAIGRWLRDWASWWDQHAPRMTDHQRAKVWQALDRLRFYEIVETELED